MIENRHKYKHLKPTPLESAERLTDDNSEPTSPDCINYQSLMKWYLRINSHRNLMLRKIRSIIINNK